MSAIFVGLLGWRRPQGDVAEGLFISGLMFALIVFAFSWAGSVWMQPVGDVADGFPWLPTVLIGLITALLLMAVVPPTRKRPEEIVLEAPPEEIVIEPRGLTSPPPRRRLTSGMLNAAFWGLIVGLILLAIAGTWYQRETQRDHASLGSIENIGRPP